MTESKFDRAPEPRCANTSEVGSTSRTSVLWTSNTIAFASMAHVRLAAIHLVLLFLQRSVLASNCSVPPLILAIKNNTLSGDGIALNRGIACSFGDQVEGLRLDFTLNNTALRNSLDCADAGNQANISQCIGASGGVFDVQDSKTWVAASTDAWNVTSIDPTPNGAHVLDGYDIASFASNISIANFPFSVWSNATSENRSSLGFGRASSLVTSFLDAGVIPSPEIGLFYGSRSVDYPSDGELILGGYNAARVNGSFSNFSLTPLSDIPCPLQVFLEDVEVSTMNGTSSSIMADINAGIVACINPVENAFQFTPAMFAIWSNVTMHPSNPPSDGSANYSDQVYPLENSFYMNELTLTLQGGYKVVIPQYELITPQRGNNDLGLYDIINSSRLAASVTSNGGRFDFPILGGVFASANYIRVDFANNVLMLANAITSDIGVSSNVTSTCTNDTAAAANPTSTPAASTPPSATTSPSSGSSGLSGGAIAGIVVGSVIGAALILFSAFCLFRRRRQRANRGRAPPVPLASRPDMSSIGPGSLVHRSSEMDDTSKTAELPSPSMASPMMHPLVEYEDSGGHGILEHDRQHERTLPEKTDERFVVYR